MLEETFQPAMMPLEQSAASPFDDLAGIHALYEPRIFRFLLMSTRDRDLALTLTQETFLKVWTTRASFRGDCAAATWITRIALNLLRSHTRTDGFRFWKRAAATAIDADTLSARLPHNGRSAEQQLIAQQALAQVWKSVEQLTPRQRTVFLLRYIEELELTEIAESMAIPLPTVKTHLYRGLERIRTANANLIVRQAKPQPVGKDRP
jgi:RNA polymerase sigma-70 factor (ECF subfamily)